MQIINELCDSPLRNNMRSLSSFIIMYLDLFCYCPLHLREGALSLSVDNIGSTLEEDPGSSAQLTFSLSRSTLSAFLCLSHSFFLNLILSSILVAMAMTFKLHDEPLWLQALSSIVQVAFHQMLMCHWWKGVPILDGG